MDELTALMRQFLTRRNSMLSYFIIGVILIIPIIGLVLIAMALCTDFFENIIKRKDEKEYYKYRDLDDNDEPLVIHGQGDYRKEIRPSDIED